MTRIRRVLACVSAGVLVVLFSSTVAPVSYAADPASEAAATDAVAWLQDQQQPDGSFELVAFPGFETRDAVLAVAEAAQTATTWDPTVARNAIEALQAGGSGPTPLDYLENLVAGSSEPGVAAKTVVLVTAPLGIDASAFGSVNLLTKLGGCNGTTAGTFNGLLYVIIAQQLLCGDAPAVSITAVRDAQQANGGWGFAGDPGLDDIDNDTTALAVEALVGSGAGPDDPAVRAALVFFAANHQANGSWQFFGEDDPNSTATAILAITAAGFDVTSPCWRDTVAPEMADTPYASPDAWLRSQQIASGSDAGRVQSPSDTFGVNTIPTSQTVQGLLRSWLPVARATAPTCSAPDPAPTTTLPVTTAVEAPAASATAAAAPTQVAVAGIVTVQPRFTG